LSETAGLQRIRVEDLLQRDSWDVDPRPHIRLNAEKCAGCPTKPCTRMCPAGCYVEAGGSIVFSYEGCLECGTCRVVCPMEAIEWDYPVSGRGIQYRTA
jgi:ferredoxin like protein